MLSGASRVAMMLLTTLLLSLITQTAWAQDDPNLQETEATVEVVWDDADNQDGKRPTSLTVTLSDGAEVTLDEGNSWTATVEDLLKYNNGEEIEYTWAPNETNLPEGYSLTNSTTVGTTTTLTFRYTPDVTSVTVMVVWEDGNDIGELRPKDMTATLKSKLKGSEEGPQPVEGKEQSFGDNGDNTWSATIEDLPVYKDGTEIEYSWTLTGLNDNYEETQSDVGTVTTYTFTRKTGKLTVGNTLVSDLTADAGKEFKFTVTLGDTSINGTYGEMTFVDGKSATFTLKDGETKNAEGLMYGTTYTVEMEEADDFTTVSENGTGTISGTPSAASFTNTRETGDLKLTNIVVSDLAADAEVEFTFTVTLSDTTIDGTYGGMTFADGIATVTLKGGEYKTATGLPTTVEYTVTQADAEGFVLSGKTGDEGAIGATLSEAVFTNTRETGDLVVSNTVVSNLSADADAVFTFTVTLSDTTISGTYGDMDFEDGVATFTLKGDESAEATGLPTDLTYTVTQADAEGFVLSGKTGDEGAIGATLSEAVFTNTRETGDLVVTNTVVSDLAADATVEFTFTVTLSDTTIDGNYGDMTFENGVATFTLTGQAGNNSKTAEGLPTTVEYTVTQTAKEGFVPDKIEETGTITTEMSTVTFTNGRITSGECGQTGSNVTWNYNPDSKTITVEGTGYMMYYNSVQNGESWSNGAPWKAFANEIEYVVISDGITYVGSNTFAHCPSISSVTLPTDQHLYQIGPGAFADCTSLTNIDIPMSVNTIGDGAFAGCSNLATVSIGYGDPGTFTLGSNVFPVTTMLLVPESAYENYIKEKAINGDNEIDNPFYVYKNKIVPATRTFFASGTSTWMTWCDVNAWTLPEGCTAYTVSSVSGTTVTLSNALTTIPAYTPVLIQFGENVTAPVTATFSAVGTVPDSGYDSATGIASTTDTEGCTFYGTTTDLATIPEANYSAGLTYVLYGDKFLKSDNNSGIAANRCWLKLEAGGGTSGARLLSIVIDDNPTAIDNVQWSMVNGQSDSWYTLDGRKLSGKPTKKGLYIYNGKKTVVK